MHIVATIISLGSMFYTLMARDLRVSIKNISIKKKSQDLETINSRILFSWALGEALFTFSAAPEQCRIISKTATVKSIASINTDRSIVWEATSSCPRS